MNPLDLLGSGHDDVHGQQLPILPHVMIGRWLSIFLLQYIGKQVQEFNHMFWERCLQTNNKRKKYDA